MISITDGLRCYYNSNMKEKTPLELERENRILQSNWNSLRECIEKQREHYRYFKDNRYRRFLSELVDKMNELEGKDKDGK